MLNRSRPFFFSIFCFLFRFNFFFNIRNFLPFLIFRRLMILDIIEQINQINFLDILDRIDMILLKNLVDDERVLLS